MNEATTTLTRAGSEGLGLKRNVTVSGGLGPVSDFRAQVEIQAKADTGCQVKLRLLHLSVTCERLRLRIVHRIQSGARSLITPAYLIQLISRAVAAPIIVSSRPRGVSARVADNGMRPAITSALLCGNNGATFGSA